MTGRAPTPAAATAGTNFSGHRFSGRYKALVVDGSGTGYLRTVCDYMHLNPVRAKLLRPEQALREYLWSSLPEYLQAPRKRWPWLRVERLLGEMGLPQDSAAGRREFGRRMEERRHQEQDGAAWKPIRRGWCLGDEAFRQELLVQVRGRFGAHHSGEERWASAEAHAEAVVQAELRRLHWTEADLERRAKGDPAKARLARRLREETTMTWPWIAARAFEISNLKSQISKVRQSVARRK